MYNVKSAARKRNGDIALRNFYTAVREFASKDTP